MKIMSFKLTILKKKSWKKTAYFLIKVLEIANIPAKIDPKNAKWIL